MKNTHARKLLQLPSSRSNAYRARAVVAPPPPLPRCLLLLLLLLLRAAAAVAFWSKRAFE